MLRSLTNFEKYTDDYNFYLKTVLSPSKAIRCLADEHLPEKGRDFEGLIDWLLSEYSPNTVYNDGGLKFGQLVLYKIDNVGWVPGYFVNYDEKSKQYYVTNSAHDKSRFNVFSVSQLRYVTDEEYEILGGDIF